MRTRHYHQDFLITVSTVICAIGIVVIDVPQGRAIISGNQTAEHQTTREMIHSQEDMNQVVIEGEVTRVQGEFVGKNFSQMKDQLYSVKTTFGEELNLFVGDHTQKSGQIFPGDRVLAKMNKEGMLYQVQKISQTNTESGSPPSSGVRRRIVGTIERMDGKFVFLKQGDRTEILHVDDNSHIQGNIREGSRIAANLGDAGYAIGIEEIGNESQPASNSQQSPTERKP